MSFRTPPLLVLLVGALLLSACEDSNPVIVEPVCRTITPDAVLDGDLRLTPNPNGNAPLTALLTAQTYEPARIQIEVLGPDPVRHTGPLGTDHRVPVLGLYPGTTNEVVARITDAQGCTVSDTLTLTTEAVPDFMPAVEITTIQPNRMEPGWTLSSLSIGEGGHYASHPFMFDAEGTVRWHLDLSAFGAMVVLVERLANGNLLFGQGGAIYEYDMLGGEVNRWPIPGYLFHHDVIEKPDGNLLVAVDKSGIGTIEDHVIELDRASGAVVNEWDLRQILDVSRRAFSPLEEDWFHMNAIWYDTEDDALILSGRNQTALVKVTRDNELVWILSPHKGWGQAGLKGDGHDTRDFLLTAVDASGQPHDAAVQQGDEGRPDFRWAWGPHAPLLLPNGNLFVFDNGANRGFVDNGSRPVFSRGVEYEIDEEAMTVRQVWQYGEERGPEFFSGIVSDVDLLPQTGNRLIMPGIVWDADPHAWVTEVAYPSGEVVFEARLDFAFARSSGQFVWGEFDLVYRSERLPIYPEPPASARWARR